jgi:hypothetical protein
MFEADQKALTLWDPNTALLHKADSSLLTV